MLCNQKKDNADVNEINKLVVTLLDSHNERIYTIDDSVDRYDENGLMAEAILPEERDGFMHIRIIYVFIVHKSFLNYCCTRAVFNLGH